MAIVIFDPAIFRQLYPEFESWTDVRLNGVFDEATIILNNTDSSIVPYEPLNRIKEREVLLNLLSAHIATVITRRVTGATTSASEGSTSASFYVPQQRGADWYLQTPYGYTYYQMTSQYRHGGRLYFDEKKHF